jgi:signal peptidase I
MLACVVLAAFVWLTGFVPGTHPMRFQGPAMRPTIRDGQVIQVRDYGGASPARGDIVIFHAPAGFPGAGGAPWCLRVIAIPGDSIALTATGVVLNGKPLVEPYVAPENADDSVILHALTLEAGQYYVMGDNRGDSADSRYFGPIGRASIVGKVVAIRG